MLSIIVLDSGSDDKRKYSSSDGPALNKLCLQRETVVSLKIKVKLKRKKIRQ